MSNLSSLINARPYNVTNITFPATQVPSSNVNCLDDYEEGTWTPTQGAGLTVVGTFSSLGWYTKIGRQVTVIGSLAGTTSVTATANQIICAGLPFPAAGYNYACGSLTTGTLSAIGVVVPSVNSIYASAMSTAVPAFYFSLTYFV